MNINSGDGNPVGSGPTFNYLVAKPVIASVTPAASRFARACSTIGTAYLASLAWWVTSAARMI